MSDRKSGRLIHTFNFLYVNKFKPTNFSKREKLHEYRDSRLSISMSIVATAAVQTCIMTVFSEVPIKLLIFKFCLSFLKTTQSASVYGITRQSQEL